MAKKKTHAEFIKEIYNLVGDEYSVLEEYKNAHTKILMRHNSKECNYYEFEKRPHSFLHGTRCPICGKKKRTTEQFKKEIYDLYGDEFSVIGKYNTRKIPILIQHNCNKCNNYTWKVTPDHIFSSKLKCPKCNNSNNNRACSSKDFKKDLYNKYKNKYTIIGNYINKNSKILIQHNSDKCKDYQWEITACNLLRYNIFCPECKRIDRENIFKKRLYLIVGNEYELISKYINNHTKIKLKHNCSKCNNYEFEITSNYFLTNPKCPKCLEMR